MAPETNCSIAPGDFYEDCSYEAMLCIEADPGDDGDVGLTGISLVNGRIGSCSYRHCGVVRLSLREAIEHRCTWPPVALTRSAGEDGPPARAAGGVISRDELQKILDRLPAAS